MQSAESISASDYPFRKTFWPQFIEKRHPDLRDRPFQPPTGSLATIPCPEKATFSNDARLFPGTHGQVDGRGVPSGKNRVDNPGPGTRGVDLR
jgi:hypothetical protein